MNTVENLLNGKIVDGLNKLDDLKFGSEEHKSAVDSLAKLMDRAIEMDKLNVEDREKAHEREFKLKQAEEERKDRLARTCIEVAKVGIPVIVVIWGTLKTFEFEKEGTITTSIGRGYINKLLPKAFS